MQDLMAKAEAWFEGQRREHLAVLVEYQPKVGLPRACKATLVTGRWEAIDKAGNMVRMETRDFFIHRDHLAQDPIRGDKIVVSENGQAKTYEVSVPAGGENAWRWSDRSESVRRIHTQVVSSTPSAGNTVMLVRAIGVSSAAEITDQQITAQLRLELGSTRAMYAQLVAASQYVYVIVPLSFGSPTIKVNGIPSSAWESTTRAILFAGQAERPYVIYRSTYQITGSPLIEVA